MCPNFYVFYGLNVLNDKIYLGEVSRHLCEFGKIASLISRRHFKVGLFYYTILQRILLRELDKTYMLLELKQKLVKCLVQSPYFNYSVTA